jgi:hypothetical protein
VNLNNRFSSNMSKRIRSRLIRETQKATWAMMLIQRCHSLHLLDVLITSGQWDILLVCRQPGCRRSERPSSQIGPREWDREAMVTRLRLPLWVIYTSIFSCLE